MWWCYDCKSQIRIRIWPNYFWSFANHEFYIHLETNFIFGRTVQAKSFQSSQDLSRAVYGTHVTTCQIMCFLLIIYKRSQNNPETLRRSLAFFRPEQSSASCATRNANKHTASLPFVFTTRNDRRLVFVVSPQRKAKKKDILVFDTENGESKLAATKLSDPVVFVKILSSKIRIR